MAIFDFLTDPLADDNKALTQDLKALAQDLQKAKPPALPQLIAEAQAALADEQALVDYARTLLDDLSLFPPSDQPGLNAELQSIIADGQALAGALNAYIYDPTSDRTQVRALATTLNRDDQSIVADVKAVVQDVHDTKPTDRHQTLAAVVDMLAHKIEAFAESSPPAPDRAFLQTVDGLEHAIDVLAHQQPIPEPERGLDRAVDTLADTIGTLVHQPIPEGDRGGLVLDTLAHAMDTLVHIGDGQPPEPERGLLLGVDTLVGTIDTLADLVLVQPGPCRELAHTIDVLAHALPIPEPDRCLDHTMDALAHTVDLLAAPIPEPDRDADAIHTLAHTIDALVHAQPIPEPDRVLVHSVDALTHTVDALTHAAPIPEPERVLDRGIHNLAHTIDALVHTLPLIDPAEDAEHVAAVDAAVHAIDVALRGGPDAHAGLIPAIDTLARAVGAVVPCIEPAPERGIDLALDTLAHTVDALAHTVDALAHGAPTPEGDRVLVTGIDTLVHSVDMLIHGTAIGGGTDGTSAPIGTLHLDMLLV